MVIDILFLFEIVVIINTAYYDKNKKLVHNRKRIFLNYLCGYLIIDVFSTIPFYLFTDNISNTNIIKLAKFTKFSKLLRLNRMAKVLKMINKFD